MEKIHIEAKRSSIREKRCTSISTCRIENNNLTLKIQYSIIHVLIQGQHSLYTYYTKHTIMLISAKQYDYLYRAYLSLYLETFSETLN